MGLFFASRLTACAIALRLFLARSRVYTWSMSKLLWLGFLLASQVSVAAPDAHRSFVKCQFKDLVRTIRVTTTESSCAAIYTKRVEGSVVDQVVGRGTAPGNCYGFIDNIRTNLEGANWSCRQFKDFTVVTE